MDSYGLIFPGYKHHYAVMGVIMSTESHPQSSTSSKLGKKINLIERSIPTLQQFHKRKLSKVSNISMYYLLSGANFSKQERHTPKKDDDRSGDCFCALELILICQNCQHSVLFDGKQNTSVLFLLQLRAVHRTLLCSDLHLQLLFMRECRRKKSSCSTKWIKPAVV